jgi:hypothetical protein
MRTSILNEASKSENKHGLSSCDLTNKINRRYDKILDNHLQENLVRIYLEKLIDNKIISQQVSEPGKKNYVLTSFGRKVHDRMRRIATKAKIDKLGSTEKPMYKINSLTF